MAGVRRLRHVRAPQVFDGAGAAVFLAGGITGCPDWQSAAVSLMNEVDATVINPRRFTSPADKADIAAEQVAWECMYLERADLVLFWFPGGQAVQPIALYELGKIAAGDKPIAVGADPGYCRRLDVVLQLSHARPDVTVHSTLTATTESAKQSLTGLAR
jgi:hypothetical protein